MKKEITIKREQFHDCMAPPSVSIVCKRLLTLLLIVAGFTTGAWAETISLTTLTEDYTAQDGDVLTGTVAYAYGSIIIPDGATITLSNLDITFADKWKCLKCVGNATINIADDTQNTLANNEDYYQSSAVITIGPSGSTLTINGTTGKLTINAGRYGPAIGSNGEGARGNIVINGGVIVATAGQDASAIGGRGSTNMGDITINGGTVTANGNNYYCAIGANGDATCGRIIINAGTVNANGGYYGTGIGGRCADIIIRDGVVNASVSSGNGVGIGSANERSCGNIGFFGGTITATGSGDAPAIGAGVGGSCGIIYVASNMDDVTEGHTRTLTPNGSPIEELVQDEDGYYLIGSQKNWEHFALEALFAPTANARMTADIDLGDDQTTVGTMETPFQGVFDGQGHTLTINFTPAEERFGLFRFISGATIRNLNVTGTITTAYRMVGSLVGRTDGGINNITNCRSSVYINSTTDEGHQTGGLVGRVSADVTLNISDCVFDGSIIGKSSSNYCGGIVGYNVGTLNMSNCLFMPVTAQIGSSYLSTLVQDGGTTNISNCYYTTAMGTVQGSQASAAQLADGTTACKLQNNRSDLVWGQRIGTDAKPVLTGDESYRVYRSKNGGYTNNPEDAYEGLKQDGEGYYLLSSVQDWKDFAALVQTTPTANAKMTADINLGDDQTHIGYSSSSRYCGAFDGGGHTLTVNYNSSEYGLAPFRYTAGATIKNLHIDGSIISTYSPESHTSGVISHSRGADFISNVWVSVDIQSGGGGWIECAAFIGCNNSGNSTITDCLFTGSMKTTSGYYNGCFFGYSDSGNVTVSNCLSTGTFDYYGGSTYVESHGGVFSNCYVRQFPADIPAEMQVSDEQLSDGTITAALQNNREETVWFQDPVTNQPMLKVFTLNQGNEPHTHTAADAVMENVVDASCEAEGGYDLVVYCSGCGAELSREHVGIAALGHDLRLVEEVPATPTSNGRKAHYECSRCDRLLTTDYEKTTEDELVIPATPAIDLAKDEEGYYLLASADDWKAFATLVESTPTANARMTAHINLGDDQTMVGTEEHPYQGTFDGQGYTLTVAYNVTEDYVAPFRFIDGATIQNLHVEGTINTTAWYAGGIVGNVPAGNNCIKNTQSSVNITGNYTGGGSQVDWHGGIVGQATNGAIINLSDCFFDGSIKGSSSDCSFCANMIGIMRNSGEAYINSCLSMASFTDVCQVNSMYHYIHGSGTTTNSYVLTGTTATDHGRAGALITTDDLTSGTIVTALQAGRDEIVWVQNPVTNAPSLKVIAEKATSTAIDAVGYSQSPFGNKQSWYTINGQRVMKPTNGIYVKDGKKVLVK